MPVQQEIKTAKGAQQVEQCAPACACHTHCVVDKERFHNLQPLCQCIDLGFAVPRAIQSHQVLGNPTGSVQVLECLLDTDTCARLSQWALRQCVLPTGVSGYPSSFDPQKGIYSLRASAYVPQYAAALFASLPQMLKQPVCVHEHDALDAPIGSVWRPIGINPLWRAIVYPGAVAQLQKHYDAPYVQSAKVRTLRSVLLYVSDVEHGYGATRFYESEQSGKSKVDHDYSDACADGQHGALALNLLPKMGTCALFDHRLVHDGAPVGQQRKVVFRTDMLYECIGGHIHE